MATCDHGWRNEIDCDVCRPNSATVRGRSQSTHMTAYLGFRRETEVGCCVEDVGCGAGRVTCFECGGDGDWTKFHPEPETGPFPCVACKGTGWIMISI